MSLLSMLAKVARNASAARDTALTAANAASRASRSAAASRAARSAATGASRAARLAATAASRAACEALCVKSSVSYEERPPKSRSRRCSLPRDPVPGKDVKDTDLESDEAIWALYEHWCKAFNKERSKEVMAQRFKLFKKSAEKIHKWNKNFINEPQEHLCLSEFSDDMVD